ncbi:MAG: GNAT family N-acetyltransferase [Candidatus Bathyarchaeota archaeon]|nr:GNAT family N-acetyltransferase [Candidatus Bathyarchaeota archaeon]MDH5494721.1 GNAT family N-acetyltransferase [Candidatus Bathyarchaeota archaeon]
MKRIKIQTLTLEDYDAIVELWKRAGLPFKPKGRDSKQMMEKQMNAFPEFFIGAFHDEKLVGVVIGSYEERMKGWINRLAVDPKYRRRGIAQQLINTIEKALEKRGVAIFCALIEVPNEESLGTFQKMGYKAHKGILYISKRKSEDI